MRVRAAFAPPLQIPAASEAEPSAVLVKAPGDPTQVTIPVVREGGFSAPCPLREESEQQAALRRQKEPKQSPFEFLRPHSVRLHGEEAPPCAPRAGVRSLEGKCTPTRETPVPQASPRGSTYSCNLVPAQPPGSAAAGGCAPRILTREVNSVCDTVSTVAPGDRALLAQVAFTGALGARRGRIDATEEMSE